MWTHKDRCKDMAKDTSRVAVPQVRTQSKAANVLQNLTAHVRQAPSSHTYSRPNMVQDDLLQ